MLSEKALNVFQKEKNSPWATSLTQEQFQSKPPLRKAMIIR